ncbi:MAG TPA: hypothetical protein VHV76_01535 [Mycobacteriales bacterium]|nr:hypothetical protein [Mycobacteriales bacterium]
MDASDYLSGSLGLLLGLVPWVPASRRLARRLVPDRTTAESALLASVIGISGVVVVAELLGLCDVLSRWPFAVASAVVAMGVSRFGRSASAASSPGPLRLPRKPVGWILLGCVAVCVVATSASLLGRDAAVVGTGPMDLDSLHYHLTQSAQMLERHNLYHLRHTASSDGTVYYPFDAELLDTVAMFGPHPDIAVFGLNLLFGWLALLACWVIGERRSAGAAALAAGAAVIALPIVTQASSGPGLNDLPAMAFVLSAIGCLAIADVLRTAQSRTAWLGALCVAGAALGLSAGTKLNALPLVVLVALGVVVFARGDRRAAALALTAPALLTGVFWYVRDWIIVGSPVPDLNLTVAGHGFHVVPYPEVKPYAYTVAHYLGNGAVIRNWFEPGLRAVWTSWWPLVGGLLLVGLLLGFVERSWPRRVVALAATVGFIAYVVTPTTAIGSPNAPILFATNTRYALPVIAVAMVLLATAASLRRIAPVMAIGFTALMVVLLSSSALKQEVNYALGVPIALGVGVMAFGARAVWRHGQAVASVLATAAVVVAGVAGVAAVQRHYVHQRYSANTPAAKLFRLVGSFQHTRIGVAGHGLQYPFYGPDFTNQVNYVGITAASGAFDGPTTCSALAAVLGRLHDDYVVVEPLPVEHTARIDRWVQGIPGVTEVFNGYLGHVYRLPTTIPADACTANSVLEPR